jgi:hypothetical protein
MTFSFSQNRKRLSHNAAIGMTNHRWPKLSFWCKKVMLLFLKGWGKPFSRYFFHPNAVIFFFVTGRESPFSQPFSFLLFLLFLSNWGNSGRTVGEQWRNRSFSTPFEIRVFTLKLRGSINFCENLTRRTKSWATNERKMNDQSVTTRRTVVE